ncbi:MAG TPA: NAD+ synthase [Pseudobdellovibrionaceae bacterium]|nr:NAD+ synthase [Pseudobdellovibrionaceae bacterium]
MRIAIAQINPTLGDFKGNKRLILDRVLEAHGKNSRLVVFPECALFGYHPFDLLERKNIVRRQFQEIKDIEKKIPKGIAVLVGLLTENESKKGRPYFNTAALIEKGKKTKFFHKTLLPTGDVFDEARFIEPGDMRKNFFTLDRKKFFLSICEDIWAWPEADGSSPYLINPLAKIPKKGCDFVINLSASPWFPGKIDRRRRVAAATAKHFKAPVLYTNLVGAQDEVIFDGRSFLMDQKGEVVFECEAFEEDLNVFNLETLQSWTPSRPFRSKEDELRAALVLGIRDFCRKTGLRKVHLGLSGGIDSALVACLAVDALGAGAVDAFALPGPFSAPESLKWAEELARNLNIPLKEIPITPFYEVLKAGLEKSLGIESFGIVHENLQSRLRGLILMAHSNQTQSLLLTTGNKAEYATGYATLYGDMCGGLAPIGDLTKHQVFQISKLYNREREIIPSGILERPPSAELRPNQKDQDSLPAYDILDAAVVNIVEKGKDSRGQTDKWLLDRVFKTEFKRWQAAPILKASSHSFGRGRRFPVAHQYRE